MKIITILITLLMLVPLGLALEATRVFDSTTVSPGGTITATYDTASDNYLTVIEDVPTGWTSSPVSPNPDGKLRFNTDYGTPFVITWTAPSGGTSTFTGVYVVSPDTGYSSFSSDVITVTGSCTPDCAGKECGTDGCGESCGTCDVAGESCDASGQCEACEPVCGGAECGSNGCGGTCGAGCTTGQSCSAGTCITSGGSDFDFQKYILPIMLFFGFLMAIKVMGGR